MNNSSLPWDNSSMSEKLVVTQLPQWFLVVQVVVRVLEGMLALLGNSLTVVAIAKFDFLKTTSNLFVCALASADLLGGIVPLFIVAQYAFLTQFSVWYVLCVIEQALSIYSSYLNVSIICLIAIERCFYISFPLRYPSIVTMHLAMRFLIGVWVVMGSLIIMLFSLGIGRHEGMTCHSANIFIHPVFGIINMYLFAIITAIIIIMYARIACIANYQANRVDEVQLPSDEQIARKAQHKVTKVMVMVLGFYFICFVPHTTIHAVVGKKMKYQPVLIIIFERVLSWVWWMSSWVNPLIYAWKSKAFARGFRLLLLVKPAPTDMPMQSVETGVMPLD